MSTLALQARFDILARYARVLKAAWGARKTLTPKHRTPLERQFLPANLEITDTPAPALPRAIIATIVTAFLLAFAWASIGMIDMVAIAPGKIISADHAKVIQPAETAVVKRLLVRDGQQVKADEPLIELEAAATATAAETERLRDALSAARLESARYDALATAADGQTPSPRLRGEGWGEGPATKARIANEQRTLQTQYQEHQIGRASCRERVCLAV